MTGTVLKFPESPQLQCLAKAHEANLQTLVIIGFDRDGEFWSDCVADDGGDVLWLLEVAKRKVMEAGR